MLSAFNATNEVDMRRSRARRGWFHGLAMSLAILFLSACDSTPLSAGMGAVVGGIIPCQGIQVPGGPHYAAGVVAAFKGQIASQQTSPSGTSVLLFPTDLVAQEGVAFNAQFHFVLPAGGYVLRAQFPPPANVRPFAEVTVRSGVTLSRDIPNMCI